MVLYVLLAGSFLLTTIRMKNHMKTVRKGHDLFFKNPWPSISKCAKDLIQKMMTYNVNEHLSASEVLKHPWILQKVT